jgi:hypothetical protein
MISLGRRCSGQKRQFGCFFCQVAAKQRTVSNVGSRHLTLATNELLPEMTLRDDLRFEEAALDVDEPVDRCGEAQVFLSRAKSTVRKFRFANSGLSLCEKQNRSLTFPRDHSFP